MSEKENEYSSPKPEQLCSEDELLKYLLAFEPLLKTKQIRYEWSFTDYHRVFVPAEGFRSIIEYVLNKVTSSHFTPDFVLIFSHSYGSEMVVEFEIGHSMEDVDEYYFHPTDIEILNQIYAHYRWQLICETRPISSLLTWRFERFEVLEKTLKQNNKTLKAQHLSVANSLNTEYLTDNALATLGLIDLAPTPSERLAIILDKFYVLKKISIFDLDTTVSETVELLVCRGRKEQLLNLMPLFEQMKSIQLPLFAVTDNIELEDKLALLEAGVSDVFIEPLTASKMSAMITQNAEAKFSLVRNSRTGAVGSGPTREQPHALTDNKYLEQIRHIVAENYHRVDFDALALADALSMPLANVDNLLQQRIYHTTEEFITSCRLAEAFDLIQKGKNKRSVYLDCGFETLDAFEKAYLNKYETSP